MSDTYTPGAPYPVTVTLYAGKEYTWIFNARVSKRLSSLWGVPYSKFVDYVLANMAANDADVTTQIVWAFQPRGAELTIDEIADDLYIDDWDTVFFSFFSAISRRPVSDVQAVFDARVAEIRQQAEAESEQTPKNE